MKKSKHFYGKDEAKMISGIAILMMLTHHFFGFADYRLDGNYFYEPLKIAGISIERILASAGKLCVAMFAFMSGFALYLQSRRNWTIQNAVKKLLNFLTSYWIVMLLFLVYGIVINDSIPDISNLVLNMLGCEIGPHYPYVNCAFAWYVYYYVFLMVFSPLIIKLFSSNRFKLDLNILLGFIVIATLTDIYLNSIPYLETCLKVLFASLVGYIVAKYNIFERISTRYANLNTIVLIGILALLFGTRQCLLLLDLNNYVFEAIFAGCAIFIFTSLLNGLNFQILKKALMLVGVYSTYLWFLHGIFFTGSRPLQSILYAPRISILIILWGVIILMPVSFVCSKMHRALWLLATSNLKSISQLLGLKNN